MNEVRNHGKTGSSNADGYFMQQDAVLIERMRQERETESARAELAAASGIDDPALLDQLLRQGISAENLEAMRVAPLVLVAWADGKLDAREREAILERVEDLGLARESSGRALLAKWLDAPPEGNIMDVWLQYVGKLCREMSLSERQRFEAHVLGLANAVALASGGFLGLTNRVSAEEELMLQTLRTAFRES